MDRLYKFMQERGFSQSELARQMGYTSELISMMLSGKRPISNSFRWRFGEVFGFEIAQQVFGELEQAEAEVQA